LFCDLLVGLGDVGGCFGCPSGILGVPWGLLGGLGGAVGGPWRDSGDPWGALVALGGPLGRLGDLGWVLWGSLGCPWASPGGPSGSLGRPLGGLLEGGWTQGGTLETNYCGKAALQNHWFYRMNVYIWALGGSLGDLGWGKFLTQTGEGEGNGDRGAHDKPKTTQERSREEKCPQKMYADHRPEPSRGVPDPKSILSCRRGWCFQQLSESKREGPR
jgi:hypothetical protein